MKVFTTIFKYSCGVFIMLLLIIGVANYVVTSNAKGKMYSKTNNIPKNRVGLLLGTGKYLYGNVINYYYKYRLDAAVELYRSGKIQYILVSGDNSRVDYDEPSCFKKDLMEAGIPENRIVLDYAGFRTLDSVVRAKKIFSQTSITIISQQFHNERAIYLAEYFGVNTVAYNAQSVSGRLRKRVMFREYFARVKVFVDLLIGKQPKFLGKKIKI